VAGALGSAASSFGRLCRGLLCLLRFCCFFSLAFPFVVCYCVFALWCGALRFSLFSFLFSPGGVLWLLFRSVLSVLCPPVLWLCPALVVPRGVPRGGVLLLVLACPVVVFAGGFVLRPVLFLGPWWCWCFLRPPRPLPLRPLGVAGLAFRLAGVFSPPAALRFRSPRPVSRLARPLAFRPLPSGPLARPWCPRVSALPFVVGPVAFSGSRSLPSPVSPVVFAAVAAVVSAGCPVSVGCAAGADAFVRSACRRLGVAPRLFSSASFPGPPVAALVARSVACVSSARALVLFPGGACPSVVSPSPLAARCFCGAGSGSWASAALAAGLGSALVVFPRGAPLPPWGVWLPLSGAFSGAFLLSPPAFPQTALF